MCVCVCVHLLSLTTDGNQLTSVPDTLGQLVNLTELYLGKLFLLCVLLSLCVLCVYVSLSDSFHVCALRLFVCLLECICNNSISSVRACMCVFVCVFIPFHSQQGATN